jgi:hypothetical protein
MEHPSQSDRARPLTGLYRRQSRTGRAAVQGLLSEQSSPKSPATTIDPWLDAMRQIKSA